MATVPTLERSCNSWVIVRKADRAPIFETWERTTAEKVNGEKYDVLTALQWLQEFAASAKG